MSRVIMLLRLALTTPFDMRSHVWYHCQQLIRSSHVLVNYNPIMRPAPDSNVVEQPELIKSIQIYKPTSFGEPEVLSRTFFVTMLIS